MPLSDAELEPIARLFRARTGIELAGPLAEHGKQGVHRAMQRLGEADGPAFCRRLIEDADALDVLIDEIAVGETYFFRQPAHYDLIEHELLPLVRARHAGGGPGLRAWSAGCASGEEIYSLAAVLAENDDLDGAHLVGSDLSLAALARARAARFREWSVRGEAGQRIRPWLSPSGDRWTVHAPLREAVTFVRLNLATDRYPERALGIWEMDVVLCRNVLIYLDPETVARVACQLRDTLAPGGWLLTGASDPVLPNECGLARVIWRDIVVYRRAAELPERPSAPPTPRKRMRRLSPVRTRPPSSPPRSQDSPVEEIRELADRDPTEALTRCERMLVRRPLSAELHYLRAVLRLGLGDPHAAHDSLRRALYIDPTLAVAHFVLGSLLRNRGDLAAARIAFRNARDAARRQPGDALLPLADGETAATLARAAQRQLHELGEGIEG